MANHPDLPAEQAYLDAAYRRLDAMRRAAADLRDSVIESSKGGTHQARIERDVFVATGLQRLEQLELGRASLCFGRIDEAATDERFYIGRLAVSDEHQEPLVVDWRAPIAESFYRATGLSPMGLRRRRHFATDGPKLLAIEDELFSADGHGSDDLELVGPGALLAALERSRSGQMRDIVATVQVEQDEIIRAEMPGVLVVQGGPGTGKTAVALHRAAYLLYTYRFPLEQQGVLVVGPNQVFLRYIEQVLPSLGESGVALATLSGLVPAVRPTHADTPEAAALKGDRRMAKVLAKAVADRQRGRREDLAIPFGSMTLRLAAGATRGIVNAIKRRPGTHNARRRQVETLLCRALHERYVALLGGRAEEMELREFTAAARREPAVVAALDRMWPLLAPEDLLNDLFGSAALLQLAADGLLSADEIALLRRERATSLSTVPWTPADLPLLDEARALLGPLKTRRRGADDDVRTYGHIVVDEAQDISAMGLRMLARRSATGSMTLVGDIGQATSMAAPRLDEILSNLQPRRPPRIRALSVNYRTPAEMMEVAAEVLAAAAVPGLVPPRSVRATGRVPVVLPVSSEGLAEEVAETAMTELAAVQGGTVAVIGPSALVADLADALDACGAPWASGLTAPITLLDVVGAKGLEFDSVIVVEPAAMLDEPGGGPRSLFVALTRPTRRLVIAHSRPLPEPVVAGLARARRMAEQPGSVPAEVGAGDGDSASGASDAATSAGF